MVSVIVIHESSDVCEQLCPAIEAAGHRCTSISSCEAAIGVLNVRGHDIAILDIDAAANPETAIGALARTRSRPEILAISDGSNTALMEQAIRAGAWDVLTRPFTHEELIQVVTRCRFHRKAKVNSSRGELKREAILGTSSCLDRCLNNIGIAAQTNASVLILGETGTGKELFANAIHENSVRASRNFIVVDCTNIPKTLAESLLFGHERGSFTGAADSRDGLFKQADGGTIFLDEIGDLDFEVQKSLLRVLQDRKFRPLSSKREISSDFRLIAATNRNLEEMVRAGSFRGDLYHRLCTRIIKLPPLRDRKEDIHAIAEFHIRRICAELGCPEKEASYELHHALTLYNWPGNVRELINVLHATVYNALAERRLYPQHLPMDIRAQVLSKRNGKHAGEGYLIGVAPCTCGLTETGCPLGCHEMPGELGNRPSCTIPAADLNREEAPATGAIQGQPIAAGSQPRPWPSAGGMADLYGHGAFAAEGTAPFSPPFAAPLGDALPESHLIPLSLVDRGSPQDDLRPLGTVREMVMLEVEAQYLRQLVTLCHGNFQRAQNMSGLSRARLYDLLKKHSMSITGGA